MRIQKIDNPEKIIKKITNIPRMAYFTLAVSIFFLAMFVFGIIEVFNNGAAIVFIIMGFILFITFLMIFFFQKNKVKKKIKNVDFDKLRKELTEEVVLDNLNKVFFTKSYILSNFYYGFILDYNDILWVYERVMVDPNTLLLRSDLMIYLNDGTKEITEFKEDYIKEILKHNNKVLVGKEYKDKYKELLKNYK